MTTKPTHTVFMHHRAGHIRRFDVVAANKAEAATQAEAASNWPAIVIAKTVVTVTKRGGWS